MRIQVVQFIIDIFLPFPQGLNTEIFYIGCVLLPAYSYVPNKRRLSNKRRHVSFFQK